MQALKTKHYARTSKFEVAFPDFFSDKAWGQVYWTEIKDAINETLRGMYDSIMRVVTPPSMPLLSTKRPPRRRTQ